MADISDENLKLLQGSKALLDKLLTGKTRRQAERLIKEHFPDTVTLDDMAEPFVKSVEDKVDQIAKDFSEFKKDMVGRKLDDKLERDIQRLRDERDFTDEGIEKLKKLMVEKEIPDIIVAADHWERQNPPKPQEPSIMGPTDWGFGRDHSKDENLKLLFDDEDAWAEQEARRVWAEETAKKGQILT
jgi:hypothetical protein